MDAFYASVEQRDNPELRGKPIAVGSPNARGVVATASYEARQFGVGSAMSSVLAKKKCPDLIFVPPRFEVYRAVSQKIRSIFKLYTNLIEPLSLDEAFLDVTNNKKKLKSAIRVAQLIREQIKYETDLTASAGVAQNKFLAKIASDIKKPDGLTVILPEQALEFISQLPVERFFGVGKVTAAKMHKLGIRTGGDLQKLDKEYLVEHFGKQGTWYYDIARNHDERPVEPHRETKSLGVEYTFDQDISEDAAVQQSLHKIAAELSERLEKNHKAGKTLTLKVKFSDFKQITRRQTEKGFFNTEEKIYRIAQLLWQKVELEKRSVRLLGLSMSSFQ